MKVLDIDLDFFLNKVTFPIDGKSRYPDEFCEVWDKEKVVDYLENTLKLSKEKKIKGRIITNHNESLDFWNEQFKEKKLTIPFQIIHIDSHSDLDFFDRDIDDESDEAGYLAIISQSRVEDKYRFIYGCVDTDMHDKWVKEGNYLIFAIAFHWVDKIVYCTNITELYNEDDYPKKFVLKNRKETENKLYKVIGLKKLNDKEDYTVDYEIITKIQNDENFGDYDFITFAISPRYTPKKADFIIEVIKEYIEEI